MRRVFHLSEPNQRHTICILIFLRHISSSFVGLSDCRCACTIGSRPIRNGIMAERTLCQRRTVFTIILALHIPNRNSNIVKLYRLIISTHIGTNGSKCGKQVTFFQCQQPGHARTVGMSGRINACRVNRVVFLNLCNDLMEIRQFINRFLDGQSHQWVIPIRYWNITHDAISRISLRKHNNETVFLCDILPAAISGKRSHCAGVTMRRDYKRHCFTAAIR